MEKERVAIIGGEGAMGQMTNKLFQDIGYETVVSDIKKSDSPTPFEAVQGVNAVFFSVLPVEEIPKIIDAVSDVLPPQNIILDNASVKRPIENALRTLDTQGLSVCSTHPLTRPSADLRKEKVLVMDVGNNAKRANELARKLYSSAGMEVIPFQFEKHDDRMAIAQLVPHLTMRAISEALTSIGDFDVDDLLSTAPVNFQLFLLGFGRVLIQDANVSRTIIETLSKTAVGEEFIAEFKRSFNAILEGKNDFESSSQALLGDSMQHITRLTNGVNEYLKERR